MKRLIDVNLKILSSLEYFILNESNEEQTGKLCLIAAYFTTYNHSGRFYSSVIENRFLKLSQREKLGSYIQLADLYFWKVIR